MFPFLSGLNNFNSMLSDFKVSKNEVIGYSTVAHVYGWDVGIPQAREKIRRYGMYKAMELWPELERAPIKEVRVGLVRPIDNKKYTGKKIRELEAIHGCSRVRK